MALHYRFLLLLLSGLGLSASICHAQPATLTYAGISTLRPGGAGGRVAWSSVLNLIAYDRKSDSGYYDVHTMNPDGTNDVCLTCSMPDLANRHKGNPDFDFSGKWIIFQVEKAGVSSFFDDLASPGSGLFNDVWVMDVAGTTLFPLTNVPATNSGVLHPHFSHSGAQITWAQYLGSSPAPLGLWEVQVADFVVNSGTPALQNIRSYQPGPMPRFYETHGFSADDQSIYITANPDPGQQWYGADIYQFNPTTGALIDLTNSPNDWDEHANLSPDGTKILWVSSTGIQLVSGDEKTDYWIMNVDGSGKRRLTWFNSPGFPESQTAPVAAARSAWSPDGSYFLGYVVTDNFGTLGPIVNISLVVPATAVSTASYLGAGTVAPDSIVALFGRNMSASLTSATDVPLPSQLGTTTAALTDSAGVRYPAQLYFVSGGQMNVYVPGAAAAGAGTISIYRDGFLVASSSIVVQAVLPGIFTADGTGSGVPAASYVNVSGSDVSYPADVFTCGAGGCSAAPIDVGNPNNQVVLLLYGTGFRHNGGATSVTATANGQPLTVQFAGAQGTFLGLDQMNLSVPPTLAGNGLVTVQISVNGMPANNIQLQFK